MNERAPGSTLRVVATGRIRVDARRAMAKLRDHLLADLHDYALEIVRAAVAFGAKAVDVSYDADELWITWSGELVAPAALGRLLDHVLTDATDEQSQRLRLLAVGVNAALGLRPARVELIQSAPDGTARVRWTPEMLEADEGSGPRPELIDGPPDLPAGAMRVHLRRRIGWAVLRRAALGGAPDEVGRLGLATADLPIALTLQGKPWPRRPRPDVVVAVPLELPPVETRVRRAVLELLDLPEPLLGTHSPSIDFCERGVRLARVSFAPTDYPSAPHAGCALPVRILVDGDALPTNASRSAVREDTDLWRAVLDAAQNAFTEACNGIAARVRDAEPPVEAVERVAGALVCVAAGVAKERSALAREMLRLPLLRNACDEARSYYQMKPASGRPLHVYEGDAPLEPELAHWLRDVLWFRGVVVERALMGVKLRESDDLIESAREALERRRQHRAHPRAPVAVPESPDHLVKKSFHETSGPYRGLRGEVALACRTTRPSTVRAFWEERQIAVQSLGPAVCPLPLDMAFAWDARLQVRFGFDGMEDDVRMREAMWFAIQVGVKEAGVLATELEDLGALTIEERDQICPIVCAAIGAARMAGPALGLGDHYRMPVNEDGPLGKARVWRTTEPGRYESLASLRAVVASTGALFHAERGARGRALDDRPVLALTAEEREWLAQLMTTPRAIPYDRGLIEPGGEAAMATRRRAAARAAAEEELAKQGLKEVPSLVFDRPNIRGVVAPAREARVIVAHAWHVLSRAPHAASFGAVVLAVDDARVVPNADWDGVLSREHSFDAPTIERELLSLCIASVEGDAESRKRLNVDRWPESLMRRYLIESATALREVLWSAVESAPAIGRDALVDLYERLLALKLCALLDEHGKPIPASLADIESAHPAPGGVPVLDTPPGFETLSWRPLLVLSSDEVSAIERWTSDRVTPGALELEQRRKDAARERTRALILRQPELDPGDLGTLAPGAVHVARLEKGGVTIAVALPPRVSEVAVAQLLYRRRTVATHELTPAPPVVARIACDDDAWLNAELGGDEAHRKELHALIVDGAVTLVTELITGDPERASLLDARVARLSACLVATSGLLGVFKDTVRFRARWPRAQGGTTALRLVLGTRDTAVPVARKLFVPWLAAKRRSRLDEAVLYIPDDEAGADLERVLSLLGCVVHDVTDALEALQARRAGAQPHEGPRLVGASTIAALRSTFAALRIEGVEGDIELGVAGGVTVIDLQGARQIDASAPMPLRAIVQVDAVRGDNTDALVKRHVETAMHLMVGRLLGKLEELPADVRTVCRAAIVAKLGGDRGLGDAERAAAVFCDTRGGWHSVAALAEQPVVWMTGQGPPYPEVDLERSVLCLSAGEAAALAKVTPVEDQSSLLRRALDGEARRRAAPQRAIIAAADREQCRWITRIDEEGIEGELGVLRPAAAKRRGISVCVDGRPLCTIGDGEGWPLCVVVDTSLHANVFFDALEDRAEATKLVERLRAIAAEVVSSELRAPAGMLASHRVMGTRPGAQLMGCFWLPPQFPSEPRVDVESNGIVGVHQRVALRAAAATSALIDGTIPVEGHISALCDLGADLHPILAEQALASLDKMLDALERDTVAAAYGWNELLLTGKTRKGLKAPATTGTVTGKRVLAELKDKGQLWFTRQEGSTEGAFPEEAPGFVLCDRGALMEVLQLRGQAVLSELGGDAGELAVDESQSIFHSSALAPPIAPPEEPPAPVTEAPKDETWLSGVVRGVLSVFRDPPVPVSEGTLPAQLETLLSCLNLPGAPVAEVTIATSGRAVRYQLKEQRVVVHAAHPALATVLPAKHATASSIALHLLAAAALTEINRAHEGITASEEQHALLELMRTLR